MKRLLSALVALLLLTGAAAAEGGNEMRLLAINVDKADCLLLTCGEDAYLIDTGTKESWGAVSAALKVHGVTRLTGVILTHTHKDHTGGAAALATSSVGVGAWYAPVHYAEVKAAKHPAVLAAAVRGEEVVWLRAGDVLPLGSGSLTVLGPTVWDEKENNNSLVLLAEGGGGRMLLAGDMEFPEEQRLMAAGVLPTVDVLKVGNHGESDATGDDFARAVSPKLAIISTNSVSEPDTPSKRVLTALKRAGAQVALTQSAQGGVLAVLRDGELTAELVAWDNYPAMTEDVAVTARSRSADTVTLTNRGAEDADVGGWYLYSDRGGEIFVFPEGAVIPAGGSVTVSAQDSPEDGDYVWPDEKVWHKSKDDAAVLCDVYGRERSRFDD